MTIILFIHQNFPGQFLNISKHLLKKYEIHSMSFSNKTINGIIHHQCYYTSCNKLKTGDLSLEFETKVIRAKIVQQKCIELNKTNIIPDIIIAHSGWGESLLLKNIWSNVKLISYMELYYNVDINESINYNNKLTLRNAPQLISLLESDYCISPTEYQKNTYPKCLQYKIDVVFEGIDTIFFKKKNIKTYKIGKLKKFSKWKDKIVDPYIDINNFSKIYNLEPEKDNIITFISRDLTPLRGFDIFLESLEAILNKFPKTYIIIVGGDGNSYCEKLQDNQSYFKIYWNKIKNKIDTDRIFFLGNILQINLIDIFSISTINIYITKPFCLSWSFMEALSTEVLMITNNNKPMTCIVEDNKHALLFNTGKLSNKVIEVLNNPDKYNHIRHKARKLIEDKYDLYKASLPKYESIIKKLL